MQSVVKSRSAPRQLVLFKSDLFQSPNGQVNCHDLFSKLFCLRHATLPPLDSSPVLRSSTATLTVSIQCFFQHPIAYTLMYYFRQQISKQGKALVSKPSCKLRDQNDLRTNNICLSNLSSPVSQVSQLQISLLFTSSSLATYRLPPSIHFPLKSL